jgi:hypothetical protein
MLDVAHDTGLKDFEWGAVELKAHLPERLKQYFEPRGALPIHPDSRRAYSRFYLRSKAIVLRQDAVLGVYTVDASRKGIRFLSPVQLYPKERVRISLPKTKDFQIEIARCRRIEDFCYECGATFIVQNQ